jgi:hypothetical protein
MSQPYGEVDWSSNFREEPEEYEIGRGQFGVLMYQPYKSEILPHWRYKNEELAEESARKISQLFEHYLRREDFVGADMAKKFLHMGFTRPMRYAKYPGGKKYDDDGNEVTPHGPDTTGEWYDPEKRKAAVVVRKAWEDARNDDRYERLKEEHR